MAWMWALTKVPWGSIVRHAPTIVEAARQFYGTTRRPASGEEPARARGSEDLDTIRRALNELEARERQQAALFADLAKQVETMATALQVLRTRLTLALWGAGLALATALAALVLVLRRLS